MRRVWPGGRDAENRRARGRAFSCSTSKASRAGRGSTGGRPAGWMKHASRSACGSPGQGRKRSGPAPPACSGCASSGRRCWRSGPTGSTTTGTVPDRPARSAAGKVLETGAGPAGAPGAPHHCAVRCHGRADHPGDYPGRPDTRGIPALRVAVPPPGAGPGARGSRTAAGSRASSPGRPCTRWDSFRPAGRRHCGQRCSRPADSRELVDRDQIRHPGVRQLIVGYLARRRRELDYTTLDHHSRPLAAFSGPRSRHLPPAIPTSALTASSTSGGVKRCGTRETARATARSRADPAAIRSFYLDLQAGRSMNRNNGRSGWRRARYPTPPSAALGPETARQGTDP